MRKFTYFLLTAMLLGMSGMWSGVKAETLTVGSNDTGQKSAPIYGTDADRYQYHTQTIYSATELSKLSGKQITKITYYQRTGTYPSSDFANVQITFKELSGTTTFSSTSFLSVTGGSVVYTGAVPATTATCEITLSSAYVYQGGDLLIDVQKTQPSGGGYGNSSWKGFQAQSGSTYTVLYGAGSSSGLPSSGTQSANRPIISFTYEEAPASSCANPGTPVASEITATSAVLTWDAAEDVTNYQFVCVAKGATPDWSDVTPQTVTTVTIEDLTKFTDYDFYVRSYCGSGDGEQSANQKVSFKTLKSCYEPTSLGVVENEITSSSAKITWSASGHGETQWQYTYEMFDDEVPNWSGAIVTDQKEATLSGLEPSTPYQVWVRSYCGESDQSEAVTEYFTTECGAVTGDGWSQNFDSESAYPDCWKSLGGTPTLSSSSWYVHSGKGLYCYGGTGNMIVILPEFTEIANQTKTLQLTFWYSNYSSSYTGASYASPQVGWITNPSDASTFHAVETLAKVASWTEASVALAGAPAGSLVAIRYGGASYSGYLLLDDFSVSEAPSCLAPSAAAGSATAYDVASISWTANGSESAWKLQYSSNNGENWSDEIAVTTNPYTLTGLSANTSYVVRVKADCGGGDLSDWSANSAAFKTPCGPADASNYTMRFETSEGVTTGSGKLPDCWDYIQSYTGYGTIYPYAYNSSSYAYAGNNSLYFYGGASSSEQIVRLPEMDRQIKGLTISFYYKCEESAYSTRAKLIVGYLSSDGTTFNAIETLDYTSSYTLYEKELSAAASDASYIAIRYAGGASAGYAYIDNVHVFPTPSCVKPTGVAGANMTASTAQISWTAGGSETAWKLQYSTDGSNWADANSGNDITANPYTLNGLSANTLYYARVKAVCGGSDVSEWSNASAAFKTACAAEALPFTEDFGGTITCWKMESCHTSTGIYEGAFRFYYNSNPPQYLISPELEVSSKAINVEFEYKAHSSNYTETFQVGYSTTTNATSAFTWGSEITCTSTSYASHVETLPAGTKYVAIKYTSNNKYYLYIDNFSVDEAPTCPKPTAVAVSSVTAHTASVSWTNGGEETAWKLQTSTDGTNWSQEIDVDAKPFSLTNLDANTTYYVRVKADCGGGDESVWSATSSAFETPCEAKALGWTENFDGQSSLPGCWSATATGTSGNQWTVETYECHSSSHSAKYNGKTSSSNSADLVTPQVTISSDAVLEFWYKNAVTAEVYVNDGTTTTKLWDIASASDWTKKTISLSDYSGKTVSFIFRGHGYSTSTTKYLYLDDIRVLRNVTLADNEDNTATLESLNGQTVYATIGRTIFCDGDYNTICMPFSLPTLEGTPLEDGQLYAFKYAVINSDELQVRIYETENGIQAGVPYLIKFPAGDNIVNPTFADVTITASAGKTLGEDQPVEFVGILKPQAFVADDESTLFVSTDNQLAWANTDANLKSFRAFFKRTDGSGAPLRRGMRARIVVQNEVATGADNVQSAVKCMKVLENGQLIIIRDGVKYTVQGQKIQ